MPSCSVDDEILRQDMADLSPLGAPRLGRSMAAHVFARDLGFLPATATTPRLLNALTWARTARWTESRSRPRRPPPRLSAFLSTRLAASGSRHGRGGCLSTGQPRPDECRGRRLPCCLADEWRRSSTSDADPTMYTLLAFPSVLPVRSANPARTCQPPNPSSAFCRSLLHGLTTTRWRTAGSTSRSPAALGAAPADDVHTTAPRSRTCSSPNASSSRRIVLRYDRVVGVADVYLRDSLRMSWRAPLRSISALRQEPAHSSSIDGCPRVRRPTGRR